MLNNLLLAGKTAGLGGDPYYDNVVLLLNGDGTNGSTTFTDLSPSPKTISKNWDAKVSTSVKKWGTGSIALDGTGDNLTFNSGLGLGNGDFTVECWVYFNSVSADVSFIASTNGGDFAWRTSTGLNIGTLDVSWDTTFAFSPQTGVWYHIAFVRSGSSVRAFVNGNQVGSTGTNTNTYNGTFTYVGSANSNFRHFNGYIDDLRVTKGIARYWSSFIPPTELQTTGGISTTDPFFSNVALLLNGDGTNGQTSFTDLSPNPVSITPDSVSAVSTSVKKYGTGSINFTASGAHLQVPASVFNFGLSTDFTVEFWLYTTTNTNTYDQFIGQWYTPSTFQFSNLANSIGIQDTSGAVTFGYAMTSIPVNTWVHIAYCRAGSNLKLFVNGVGYSASRNATISPNLSYPVGIGKVYPQNGYDMNGYIDDLRVTKGVARYTSDFTPPTAALPTS